MEPEGSLPCSQEPATGPSPESDELSPYPVTLFIQNYILTLSDICAKVSEVVSSLQIFQAKFCMHCSGCVLRQDMTLGNGPIDVTVGVSNYLAGVVSSWVIFARRNACATSRKVTIIVVSFSAVLDLLYATDGRTDMVKLIGTFLQLRCKFAYDP
jgi:hypothetical protein